MMSKFDKILAEYQISIDLWKKYNEMLWNRFSIFVTVVSFTIGTVLLVVQLALTGDTFNMILLQLPILISVSNLFIGLLWFILFEKANHWKYHHLNHAIKLQRDLEFNVLKDNKKYYDDKEDMRTREKIRLWFVKRNTITLIRLFVLFSILISLIFIVILTSVLLFPGNFHRKS